MTPPQPFPSKFILYCHQSDNFSFQTLIWLIHHGSAKNFDSPLPINLSSFQMSIILFTMDFYIHFKFLKTVHEMLLTLISGYFAAPSVYFAPP